MKVSFYLITIQATYNQILHGSNIPLLTTAYSKHPLLNLYPNCYSSSSSNHLKHTISSISLTSSMHTIAHSAQITVPESHPLLMSIHYSTLKKRATSSKMIFKTLSVSLNLQVWRILMKFVIIYNKLSKWPIFSLSKKLVMSIFMLCNFFINKSKNEDCFDALWGELQQFEFEVEGE